MARRGGIRPSSIRPVGTMPISAGVPIQGQNSIPNNLYEEFLAPFQPNVTGLARSVGSIAVEITPNGGAPYYSKWFIKADTSNYAWEKIGVGSLSVGSALVNSGVAGGTVQWINGQAIVKPFDWFEGYRAKAEVNLNLSGAALSQFQEDFVYGYSLSSAVGTNGGTVAQASWLTCGSYTASASGLANSGAYGVTGGGSIVISNVKTKAWQFAARVKTDYGPSVGKQLFCGFELAYGALAVGLGFDGAVDATHWRIGMFNLALPHATSNTTIAAGAMIAGQILEFYLYSIPGMGMYGSVNGSIPALIGNASTLPTYSASPMPLLIFQSAATADNFSIDKMDVEVDPT